MGAVSGRIAAAGRTAATGRTATSGRGSTASRTCPLLGLSSSILKGYYRLDSGLYVLSSGKISQINDQSGNNNHFTQASSNKRPTLSAATLNGRPSSTWGGSHVMASSAALQSSASNWTMGMVLKTTVPSVTQTAFFAASFHGVGLSINGNSTGKRDILYNAVGFFSDGAATTNPEVWIVQRNSSTVTMYTGTAMTPQSLTSAVATPLTPSSPALLGAITTTPVQAFTGDIWEVFFVQAFLSPALLREYLLYVTAEYGSL